VIKIGKYQHGGLALTPQIAMIAESGPEIVLPLSNLSKLVEKAPTIINVYLDGKKISSTVLDHAAQRLKSRGIKV